MDGRFFERDFREISEQRSGQITEEIYEIVSEGITVENQTSEDFLDDNKISEVILNGFSIGIPSECSEAIHEGNFEATHEILTEGLIGRIS